MTIEDGFSLLLNLKLPALLGILYLIQHIGTATGAGQNIMSICKRLVILKIQEWRTIESVIGVKHKQKQSSNHGGDSSRNFPTAESSTMRYLTASSRMK